MKQEQPIKVSNMSELSPVSTCRVCLMRQDTNLMQKMTNTFIINNQEFSIQAEIQALNLKIDSLDGKPQTICSCCFGDLTTAVKFRARYIHSQNVLENAGMNPDILSSTEELTKSQNVPGIYEPEFVAIEEMNSSNLSNTEKTIKLEDIEYLEEYRDVCIDYLREPILQTIDMDEAGEKDIAHGQESIKEARELINVDKTGDEQGLEEHQVCIKEEENVVSDHETFTEVDESFAIVQESHPEESLILNQPKEDLEMRETREGNKENKEQKVMCYMCDAPSFANATDLKEHVDKTHVIDDFTQCYICKRKFNSILVLYDHVFKHRQTGYSLEKKPQASQEQEPQPKVKKTKAAEPLQCHFCKTFYDDAESLQNHVKLHFKDVKKQEKYKVSTCLLCDLTFSSSSGLLKHGETIHKDTILECPACPRKYTDMHTYLRHYYGSHANIFKCRFCNKTCSTRSLIEKHERVHTGEKPFLCTYCGKSFTQRVSLSIHIRTHTNERNYICTVCGKGFISRGTLNYHTATNHDVNGPFLCHLCGSNFKFKSQIKQHMNRHAKGKEITDNSRHHSCHKCGKRFKYLVALNNHLESVHCEEKAENSTEISSAKSRKYSCSVCKMKFKLLYTLNRHMEIHKEKRSYKCDHCEWSSKTLAHLRSHVKSIHDKERPHKCHICDKAFLLPNYLKIHMYSHTGEKPFKCEICGKAFRENRKLINHNRLEHTGVQEHQCNVCNQSFLTYNRLYCHLKVHEMEEQSIDYSNEIQNRSPSISEE
ncbi:hypothetical protein DMENIID0001_133110 [Sergentomyia squamirostris]